jgi:cysteine desulfurase
MNESGLCYLDNNATTRVAPEVIEAMLPYFRENWGNPSSAYSFGHQLTKSIDAARANVAALLNAEPREIVFTSCGTESNNTAIQSALVTRPGKKHLLTTAVEHSATLKSCEFLRKQGVEVTFLPVSSDGGLDLHLLSRSIRPETALVSAMWANNETGVLFPVAEIAAICRHQGVLFHTDAVQSASKLKTDLKEVAPDFVSLSAHKLYAPKGIGALYIKRHTRFQPYLLGGGQERGRRGGTENVPYIVGFGRAAELALARVNEQQTRVRALRDRLEQGILRLIPRTAVNGSIANRLPNTSNIAFEGIEAEGVLMLLDQAGICASSGSACTTGSLDPSHVLVAMGCTAARARASVRFSLGIYNTDSDVDHVLDVLPGVIEKLRLHAPAED